MIAIDLSNDVVIPQLVTIVGALVAATSAVIRSWIENRDSRARGDRKLELARKRTEFAKEWIDISSTVDRSDLRQHADRNLEEAMKETERAFYEASSDTSTTLQQLRKLLLLVRRRNPASYVVTALFLFLSVFVWLLVCIPAPGDEFSALSAVAMSIALTISLRVIAGVVVGMLERLATTDGETITTAAVSNNVVTLTTKAPHGFDLDIEREVVIDASDDRFDGTYTVTPTAPNEFWFKPKNWAPNVERLPVQGWVCGDKVGAQLRRLLLIPRDRRSPLAVALSVVFLGSVLVVSTLLVQNARADLADTGYPFCYAKPYEAGYFGEADYFGSLEESADFLNGLAPFWGAPGILPIGTVEVVDGRLVATDGTEFVFDNDRLRFASKGTVLYERTGDDRLEPIDDPCEPQLRNVMITKDGELNAALLFTFYDDSAGFATGEDLQFVYESSQKGSTEQLKVFFGPDGRLVPVCDPSYAAIKPCLDVESVEFDSGLDATINRAFVLGLAILGFAIGLRLLIWLVGKLPIPRKPTASTSDT